MLVDSEDSSLCSVPTAIIIWLWREANLALNLRSSSSVAAKRLRACSRRPFIDRRVHISARVTASQSSRVDRSTRLLERLWLLHWTTSSFPWLCASSVEWRNRGTGVFLWCEWTWDDVGQSWGEGGGVGLRSLVGRPMVTGAETWSDFRCYVGLDAQRTAYKINSAVTTTIRNATSNMRRDSKWSRCFP